VDGMNWARANWDRLTGWSLVAGGTIVLLIGSVRVAGARYLADQLSFLMSAGVAGFGAIVLGSVLLMIASQHDEWRKLDRLETAVRQTSGVALVIPLPDPKAESAELNAAGQSR
jgi:hypothetical protein